MIAFVTDPESLGAALTGNKVEIIAKNRKEAEWLIDHLNKRPDKLKGSTPPGFGHLKPKIS